uniref:ubiquitin domain-containing protein UBFD1 isoform X3 n=1 Tax=Myxine glutinosa TaxID=7769 RepID=UPI00358F5D53
MASGPDMEDQALPESSATCKSSEDTITDEHVCKSELSNGSSEGGQTGSDKEQVDIKIVYNKSKFDVKVSLDDTGASLKSLIHTLTGVPPAMQKVMYKGLLREDQTLREMKVTSGAKIMVVGSTLNDVLAVNTPKESSPEASRSEEPKKEPLCQQKLHRKVLDKGKPDDIMVGIIGMKERLPTVPLSGMFNKSGGKVRLTFKLEQDQLWIGTKVSFESVHNFLRYPAHKLARVKTTSVHLRDRTYRKNPNGLHKEHRE